VLVLAGLDPSGGAGIGADIPAIAANGAHALPVVTALTVQDQNRVYAIEPVAAGMITRQVQALAASVEIRAVKIGIPGDRTNALAIVRLVTELRRTRPGLPVVLDPVLASGHGDPLAQGDALAALEPLLTIATVLVPNGEEARALGPVACEHFLVTGGHGGGETVINRWHSAAGVRTWSWPRLPGQYHGSGCTLAAAIAALLARGAPMATALETAQRYCHAALAQSYAIGAGQHIPNRHPLPVQE
jgi:hydroxymethylpyrimidine/phosphomethylpyrimidine kinase